MSTLRITIELKEVEDFDGNLVTIKVISSTIDYESTNVISSEDYEVSDAQCKLNHKSFLTQRGFTWDNEE